MSVSKLESLPNEILIEIFEKYLNGIDIIKAFAFQLNRRFDALVAQCRQLRLDFIRCHKDDFRICMGLLPAYDDRIEELALSEQNAPGQIHAFLSFYPSFSTFKQLRRLYFHMNIEAVGSILARNALRSLSNTSIETLSIQVEKSLEVYGLDYIIVHLFRMKTLRKLIVVCNVADNHWRSLDIASSNIEYLIIKNMSCAYQDLRYIFRCAPDLKYLDIDIAFNRRSSDYLYIPFSKQSIPQLPVLHTAIFNIYRDNQPTLIELEPYFQCMPSLHRLEIRTYEGYGDFSAWEAVLQTSLPSLKYFAFEMIRNYLTDRDMSDILHRIQTPFWMEKQNFNIIIKYVPRLYSNRFSPINLNTLSQYKSDKPAVQWWTSPQRQSNGDLLVLNKISRLYLWSKSLSLLHNYYLDNVTHLIMSQFNDSSCELIIKHVNCSRIKHLDVSSTEELPNGFSSLLPYLRNITSLRINLDQLSDGQYARLKECKDITCLNISAHQHKFDTNEISLIGSMFPNLEHLTINTNDLRNVPKLEIYLPRLRSLTFQILVIEVSRYSDGDYEEKLLAHTIRRKAQFLFQCENNYITVWIDQAALQDSYWRLRDAASITNSSSEGSTEKSWPYRLITAVFSLFKK